eukprot:TRINITY_DN3287_c0_g1_i1.p1 TRINITY_DN3287_c0_g1~~TRINITY_DN3287_c0_g1_i1.p1  ORF type:complete len:702 (-),score=295.00 TRINITY_DN3287_c0_g1_i1:1173-3278(-)
MSARKIWKNVPKPYDTSMVKGSKKVRVVAEWDFDATENTHLGMKKGDIVEVLEHPEGSHWWSGEIVERDGKPQEGTVGWFPCNRTKVFAEQHTAPVKLRRASSAFIRKIQDEIISPRSKDEARQGKSREANHAGATSLTASKKAARAWSSGADASSVHQSPSREQVEEWDKNLAKEEGDKALEMTLTIPDSVMAKNKGGAEKEADGGEDGDECAKEEAKAQAAAEEEARKAEEAKKAEEVKKAEEARKAEEEAEEAAKKAEEAKRAEEARQAEEARKEEEARKAEEAKKAEEARKEEDKAESAAAARGEGGGAPSGAADGEAAGGGSAVSDSVSDSVSGARPGVSEFKSELLLSDEEILALGVKESNVEMYRRMRYKKAFGVDTWYAGMEEHTFATTFVELSFDAAAALMQKHRNRGEAAGPEDEAALKALAQEIDAAIASFASKKAFIKLNTRSPKDVPVYAFKDPEVIGAVDSALDALPEDASPSEVVSSFVVATNRCLLVEGGAAAVRLLVRSDRIYEDLGVVTDFGREHFSAHVVVREWDEEMVAHPEMEFRCFVGNGTLNAITQYFSFCHYPQLEARKPQLQQTIAEFHASVGERIPHSSYVVDYFVRQDGSVLVIELNPFHNGAGAGLFSWRDDRELFLHGPLEMRVSPPTVDPYDVLPVQWKRHIDARRHADEGVGDSAFAGPIAGESACCVLL